MGCPGIPASEYPRSSWPHGCSGRGKPLPRGWWLMPRGRSCSASGCLASCCCHGHRGLSVTIVSGNIYQKKYVKFVCRAFWRYFIKNLPCAYGYINDASSAAMHCVNEPTVCHQSWWVYGCCGDDVNYQLILALIILGFLENAKIGEIWYLCYGDYCCYICRSIAATFKIYIYNLGVMT